MSPPTPPSSIVQLSDVRADERFQARAKAIDAEHVRRLVDALAAGATLPPIVVVRAGAVYLLADGWHRVAAHRQAGRTSIEANIMTPEAGVEPEIVAAELAAAANSSHGLPRGESDQRRAVAILLTVPAWRIRSDREIATHCSVSPTIVGQVRAAGEFVVDVSLFPADKRATAEKIISEGGRPTLGTDGKVRDARSNKRKAKASGHGYFMPSDVFEKLLAIAANPTPEGVEAIIAGVRPIRPGRRQPSPPTLFDSITPRPAPAPAAPTPMLSTPTPPAPAAPASEEDDGLNVDKCPDYIGDFVDWSRVQRSDRLEFLTAARRHTNPVDAICRARDRLSPDVRRTDDTKLRFATSILTNDLKDTNHKWLNKGAAKNRHLDALLNDWVKQRATA